MDRKAFLQKFSGIMLVGIPTLVLVNCSSDSDDPPAPGSSGSEKDCLANGTSSSIGGNHGHSLTVSKADVEAGVETDYNIQGTSTHGHSVTVTTSHFDSLKNNQSVTVSSSAGGGHTHSITVSCA